jgi:hypothetical protein
MRTLTFVALLSLFMGGLVHAQTKKAASDKPSHSRGSADARDPNIKNQNMVNKVNPDIPAPPSKGGTSRQGVCMVHVDNHTNLIVKIYVDGSFRGVMSPWGDLYTYTGAGSTALYARADFDDGTYNYWGPRQVDCFGTYTWRLNP